MLPIFISGPHGSGKTTLINSLLQTYLYDFCNVAEFDFFKKMPSMKIMNAFERCLLRLYHRFYIEQYTYCNQFSKTVDSQKILLISRGIYDSIVYCATEYSLGELSEEEYETLLNIQRTCLSLHNSHTIILNPPVSTILERLEKRRLTEERKMRDIMCKREDTYEYVSKVHKEFEKYKNLPNVLYITDNDSSSIDKIIGWTNNKMLI